LAEPIDEEAILAIIDAHANREMAWLKAHKVSTVLPPFTLERCLTIAHMCNERLLRQFKEQDAKREILERRIATVLKCMQHNIGCLSCVAVLLGDSDEKLVEHAST